MIPTRRELTHTWPLAILFFVTGAKWFEAFADETLNAAHDEIAALFQRLLTTTLCRGQCVQDCRTFVTPMHQCYNGKQLFPVDPSWSTFDILDIAVAMADNDNENANEISFERFIFDSTDATCRGNVVDYFVLPTDTCVGPFGEPRPWGTFTIVDAAKRSKEAPL